MRQKFVFEFYFFIPFDAPSWLVVTPTGFKPVTF